MQTECSPTLFEFEPVERRKVVAGFDGGTITSDAGALLPGQLDRGLGLIADRTSLATMKANQLRLWFSSMAYVLLNELRRIALRHTRFADATCGTIRLKLLKIGAVVIRNTRRVTLHLSSACPDKVLFHLVAARLKPG